MTSLAIHDGKSVRKKAWPSWPSWDEQERAALERVLESGHWSQWESEEVQRFERPFAGSSEIYVNPVIVSLQSLRVLSQDSGTIGL